MQRYVLIKRHNAKRGKHYYTLRVVHPYGSSIHGRFNEYSKVTKRAEQLAAKYECGIMQE